MYQVPPLPSDVRRPAVLAVADTIADIYLGNLFPRGVGWGLEGYRCFEFRGKTLWLDRTVAPVAPPEDPAVEAALALRQIHQSHGLQTWPPQRGRSEVGELKKLFGFRGKI